MDTSVSPFESFALADSNFQVALNRELIDQAIKGQGPSGLDVDSTQLHLLGVVERIASTVYLEPATHQKCLMILISQLVNCWRTLEMERINAAKG